MNVCYTHVQMEFVRSILHVNMVFVWMALTVLHVTAILLAFQEIYVKMVSVSFLLVFVIN